MNEPNREETLFASVLELPSDQRLPYLDDACAGDVELRRRVEDLLRLHEDAGGFLETPAAAAASGTATATSRVLPVSEKPGDRIGRYRILEQIGEGGCGIVYMAEQETPVRRRVALKIIKLGMDTREVVARFEAERQALALMDHPNIARVFDGGATESGRPYFVMELVGGEPITRYCDERRLTTRERLTLFMQVCQAVQHAHQKGIIHRDLKPSNVLVTELDGRATPKVIDFGVAKATEQRLTEQTMFTRFGQIIGTPAYMSPEQAGFGGLDIDTRSDVYSLGVLLYELLTGRPPFDTRKLLEAGYDAILKTIREVKPPTPSARLTQDLVAAGANSLKTGPRSREAKSEAADRNDPHRMLHVRELIHALRGDLDWIVMKCLEKDRARRYETASGLAADIQRHLNNEPIVARPPSKLYEFQKTVLRHKFGFAATAALILVLAAGVVVSTREAVRANRAERREAALLRQAEQARIRAESAEQRAAAAAARSEQEAQFVKDMLKAVEPAVALGDDTRLLRRILDDTTQRVERELTNQPLVKAELCATLADTYFRLQDHVNAAAMAREALRLRREVLGETNASIAGSLTELARVLMIRGGGWHLSEAEENIKQAFEIWRVISEGQTPEIAASLSVYAGILQRQVRLAEAEKNYREALLVRESLSMDQRETALILNHLGVVLRDQGKFPEARVEIEKALSIQKQTLAAEHPDIALTLENLSESLRFQGRISEAETAAREVLAIHKKAWGAGHPKTEAALKHLADLLHRQEKSAQVAALYHEHADVLRARGNARPSNSEFATAVWIGGMLRHEGRFAEAAAVFREAADHAKTPSERSLLLLRLAETYRWHGKLDDAEDAILEAITVDEHWYRTHFDLGRLHADRGRFLEAVVALSRALALAKDEASRLPVLLLLAPATRAVGKSDEADAFAREAAKAAGTETLRSSAWRLATSPESIHRSGSDAVVYAEEAVSKTNRRQASHLDTLAAAYAETGFFDKAVQVQREAIALENSPHRKNAFESRLKLYESGTPYRDPDAIVIQGLNSVRSMGIPPRDPQCPANCLDLSAHYNAGLKEDWHFRQWKGNNLATLPTGRQRFAGVEFDVRGIVQLAGQVINYQVPGYPEQVVGISLRRVSPRLHFLQAAVWGRYVLPGTHVGSFIIRYADGKSEQLPLKAQQDLDEWQFGGTTHDLPRAKVAWTGRNARGADIRLFVRTWENPRPEVVIESLEFHSEMTDAAPFLIAITAE